MASTAYVLRNNNFETFSLIWLDQSIPRLSPSIEMKHELRHIMDAILAFDDDKICEQYLLCLSENDHVVFLITGQISHKIVSRLHQISQITSIYLHTSDCTQSLTYNKVTIVSIFVIQ